MRDAHEWGARDRRAFVDGPLAQKEEAGDISSP
jgi:hypothetical protein